MKTVKNLLFAALAALMTVSPAFGADKDDSSFKQSPTSSRVPMRDQHRIQALKTNPTERAKAFEMLAQKIAQKMNELYGYDTTPGYAFYLPGGLFDPTRGEYNAALALMKQNKTDIDEYLFQTMNSDEIKKLYQRVQEIKTAITKDAVERTKTGDAIAAVTVTSQQNQGHDPDFDYDEDDIENIVERNE